MQMQLEAKQPSAEDGFREALKDVISIVTKLGVHCTDLAHLIEICQLATKSPAQLHFLMSLVQSAQ